MKNMALDGVNSGPEFLTVRVMPRNRPPLMVFEGQGLPVHTVMFPIVERIGKCDVKAIKSCAEVIRERDRNQNVVGGAIPRWGRCGDATNPGIGLSAIHGQLDASSGGCEPFNFCL